jgi:hypothetical protein
VLDYIFDNNWDDWIKLTEKAGFKFIDDEHNAHWIKKVKK